MGFLCALAVNKSCRQFRREELQMADTQAVCPRCKDAKANPLPLTYEGSQHRWYFCAVCGHVFIRSIVTVQTQQPDAP